MKISTRGRYALRFMIYLALHNNGEYITLRDVSKNEGISLKYLEQITTLLSKFGLLNSVRGPQGGYKLSKAPAEYKVSEILKITEGNLASVACLEAEENNCARKAMCYTLPVWTGLQKVVNDYLSSITLETIIQNHK